MLRAFSLNAKNFLLLTFLLSFALSARLSGRLQMDFGFTLPFLITITCYSAAALLLSRKFLKKDNKKPVAPTGLKEEIEDELLWVWILLPEPSSI